MMMIIIVTDLGSAAWVMYGARDEDPPGAINDQRPVVVRHIGPKHRFPEEQRKEEEEKEEENALHTVCEAKNSGVVRGIKENTRKVGLAGALNFFCLNSQA